METPKELKQLKSYMENNTVFKYINETDGFAHRIRCRISDIIYSVKADQWQIRLEEFNRIPSEEGITYSSRALEYGVTIGKFFKEYKEEK